LWFLRSIPQPVEDPAGFLRGFASCYPWKELFGSLCELVIPFLAEPIAKLIKTVTPAEAGVQNTPIILDSRLRGNDCCKHLQLSQLTDIINIIKVFLRRNEMTKQYRGI